LSFLKAGEIYEMDVSLIAFYIIGGSYEFFYPVKTIKSSFMKHSLTVMDGKIEPSKAIELPKSVEGYTFLLGIF
jgi:hypothetical protein